MSGHSKWANIKRKKEKTDAVKGRVFTKIGREIAIAVREGGPDPSQNGKLRDIVAKAKAANLPNDNIMRSIKKAAGESDSVHYEEITYEGYAPGGVAVLVECITDNLNRTVSDVRHAFSKYGGAMGATGCVGWMFDKKGVLVIDAEGTDEDTLMMDAIDAGADDVAVQEDAFEVTCDPAAFNTVRETLENKGYAFLEAQVSQIPQNTVTPENEEAVDTILKLIDMLEDLDDVQDVWHNAELPEEEEEE